MELVHFILCNLKQQNKDKNICTPESIFNVKPQGLHFLVILYLVKGDTMIQH